MRISGPPTISPCYYGIDTPNRSELIGATHSVAEIREFVGADTLTYLTLDGLLKAVGSNSGRYCTSCYTGKYPVEPPHDTEAYLQLALKLPTSSNGVMRTED
jgi:amidophosphoribosyltransferase